MIPVTVERRFQNADGSYTWWVDNVLMDEETRLKNKQPPPNPQVGTTRCTWSACSTS